MKKDKEVITKMGSLDQVLDGLPEMKQDTNLVDEPVVYVPSIYELKLFTDGNKGLIKLDPASDPDWESKIESHWVEVTPTTVIDQAYFKDSNNNISVLDLIPLRWEDWDRDIDPDWISITEEEANAILRPPLTDEQKKALAVAEAEADKAARLKEATAQIEILKDTIEFSEATEEDIRLYDEWRKYRALVNKVDPQLAPDINWPQKP